MIGKNYTYSGHTPRASRNVREGWPLGKAARATRAVSSGTGAMTCGWSDMTDILLLLGGRHQRKRATCIFLLQKIFSVVKCEKRPLLRSVSKARAAMAFPW